MRYLDNKCKKISSDSLTYKLGSPGARKVREPLLVFQSKAISKKGHCHMGSHF